MTQNLSGRRASEQCLSLTNDTIKEAYKHVTFLASFRYRRPIEVLQTRHRGYGIEDFIQETMTIILQEFSKKKFPTINHLKSFINLTMQWHYLKEKRKYFYTKQRGEFLEVSINDSAAKSNSEDIRTIGDTLTYDKNEVANLSDMIDLHHICHKHLFIAYDWKDTLEVCKVSELKKYRHCYALSFNHFIKVLQEQGERGTCAYFKERGFFMTRKVLDAISQKLIQYFKDNQLIEVAEEKSIYRQDRRAYESRVRMFEELSNTCTCGYKNTDSSSISSTWQCPKCGKIHHKKDLFNLHRDKVAKEMENVLSRALV